MGNLWTYVRLLVVFVIAATWVAGTAWTMTRATDYSWALWLEHWTGDIRTGLFSHRPKRQDSRIALVTITDETMQPYPYRSPVDRSLLANLVSSLDAAGVRSIGLDFLFLKPTEPAKDAELVAAMRAAKTTIVVAAADSRVGINPAQAEYQDAFLRNTKSTGGYANLITDQDNVVRYVADPEKDTLFPKSFAEALTSPDPIPAANGPRRIAWMLSPLDGNERFFSIPAHLLVTPAGKPTPLAPALLSRFKDKIVIIGGDFPDVDRHEVPLLSWRGEDNEIAGMVIHAQITAQLLDGRHIEHVDQNILLGLFAVLAGLGLWFGLRHGFVAVSLYASSASAVVIATDMALFHFMDRLIPFGVCLAALIAGVLGGIILRRTRGFLLRPA